MSKDIKCPYCGVGQDIVHDDGYGYEEDKVHSQTCTGCEKTFIYTTIIIFHYEAEKADCLNGKPHKWENTNTYPRKWAQMICTVCSERREMTEAEKLKFVGYA